MSVTDPTGSEIQQSETPDYPAVKVQVETPVKTQRLGAIAWSTRRYNVDNTQAIKIAPENPKRCRMLITVRGQIAYLGASPAEASPNAQGVILPAPDKYELTHTREVWLIGGAAAASEIGVIEEFWAN